jgi:hypothetical protein
MRAQEIAPGFKVFKATVRVKNPTYTGVTDVTIFAKNHNMAREMLKAQYGKDSLVTVVSEVK